MKKKKGFIILLLIKKMKFIIMMKEEEGSHCFVDECSSFNNRKTAVLPLFTPPLFVR